MKTKTETQSPECKQLIAFFLENLLSLRLLLRICFDFFRTLRTGSFKRLASDILFTFFDSPILTSFWKVL